MASRSRADTSSPKPSEPAPPHERQARRRLIGAAALALVVGMLFSVFFDAEPRRVRDDVQVRIPSRDASGSGTVQPSSATSPAAPSTAVAEAPLTDPPSAVTGSPVGQGTESRSAAVAEAPPAGAPLAGQPVSEPAPPAPAPVASAQAPKADAPAAAPKADAVARPPAKAARAEGKAESKAESKTGGYYLQVGAFASEKAASDQVERIKRLGATAFKESIRTQQGERIRVRLGPYPTREASDPVRNRLRAAGIDVTLVAP